MSKFKIPVSVTSTPRSIRFPDDLINDVEELIRGQNSTFSAFVVEATRTIVNELKEKEDNL